MVRKYKDVQRTCVGYESRSASQGPTSMEDPDETICIDPNNPSIDDGWEDPIDSDPTPLHALGDSKDITTAYLLATQRCTNTKPANQSGEIDTRATRLVLQLIHAPLLESARTHIDRLRRQCATEDAIIIIEQTVDKGLHFEDIDESLTEPEYKRLKSDCRRQSAMRTWHKIQREPSLLGVVQIHEAIKRGDISLIELYVKEGKYDQAIARAHRAFAEQIIALLKKGIASKELFALLKTAVETFHVNITPLGMTLSEYRTFEQLYQLAS